MQKQIHKPEITDAVIIHDDSASYLQNLKYKYNYFKKIIINKFNK